MLSKCLALAAKHLINHRLIKNIHRPQSMLSDQYHPDYQYIYYLHFVCVSRNVRRGKGEQKGTVASSSPMFRPSLFITLHALSTPPCSINSPTFCSIGLSREIHDSQSVATLTGNHQQEPRIAEAESLMGFAKTRGVPPLLLCRKATHFVSAIIARFATIFLEIYGFNNQDWVAGGNIIVACVALCWHNHIITIPSTREQPKRLSVSSSIVVGCVAPPVF